MTQVFISSLALMGKSPEEMIAIASKHQWPLEFSSGMAYRADMEEVYLNAKVERMPHNYFPAPKIPFVLNLASSSEEIRRTSIEHCKRGLWLAKQTGSAFFSAHAGFCVDPDPAELGKKIEYKANFDRSVHKNLFIQSLKEILDTADEYQLDFLIENNVIAPFNMVGDINPLLCCESEEIKWAIETTGHARLGLLLDTAHLKVTCKTLSLSIESETMEILPYVRGVHHSDNNGLVDDNQPIDNNYWFLPYMTKLGGIVHVLEVKRISEQEIQQQVNILQHGGR